MRWLSAGQFAKLCGISKGALLYYDSEGLLKPAKISENGYRYYDVEQFYTFELISMLKLTGCSLKEIKKHLNRMDGNGFLEFLEDREKATQHELQLLLRRKAMLADMIECLHLSQNATYDMPAFEYMDAEKLEFWATDASPADSAGKQVLRVKQHQAYLDSFDEIPRAPFGIVIDTVAALHGEWLETFYFNSARNSAKESSIHVKNAGMYAVMCHKGTSDSHPAAVKKLLAFVENSGAGIIGSVYIYDMMTYIRKDVFEIVALKYCVQTNYKNHSSHPVKNNSLPPAA